MIKKIISKFDVSDYFNLPPQTIIVCHYTYSDFAHSMWCDDITFQDYTSFEACIFSIKKNLESEN